MRERDAVRMMLTLSGDRGQSEVYPVREGRGEIRARDRKCSCLVGGEEERYSDRVQARLEEMGTKVPSLRPGTGTVTKKGLTGT